ncbi:MAG: hypothetical protein DRI57_28505 [Deltaproteobacteria bacterium]|nr:MAG: hypothetical protein DRI57_28505 [Deltaproteobacteria bacterium]
MQGAVNQASEGSEFVSRTDEAFKKVAAIASEAARLVGEIAIASKEQAGGIEQANRVSADMDKVTQQNVANAQELASASEVMNSQAGQMKDFVEELGDLIGEKSA